jgi:hypothetical protein
MFDFDFVFRPSELSRMSVPRLSIFALSAKRENQNGSHTYIANIITILHVNSIPYAIDIAFQRSGRKLSSAPRLQHSDH